MSALNYQVGGDHYKRLEIQPVEFILSNAMGFCEGEIVNYMSRWKLKGGVEDIRKARHFLQILIESPWYQSLFTRIRKSLIYESFGDGPISATHYIEKNNIGEREAGVILHIYFWNANPFAARELIAAMRWLDELLEHALSEGYK